MKALKKIGGGILLFLALGYLGTKSGYVFHDLLDLLSVEFITYSIPHALEYYKVGALASAVIAAICVWLEWKRENRKVSYLIYLIYLSAPFVAAFWLFLITASIVSSMEPAELDFHGHELSTSIIPMRLVFIGYILFPIAHFTITRIKGRSSRATQ